MAPKAATGGIKGFYKQKKSGGGGGGGVSKGKPGPKPKKSGGSLGSDVAQPPALVTHGGYLDLKEDYNEQEEILNQFDMNMAYGPCIGMSRLARWERANELGMNPPKDVEELMRSGKVGLECLWDGRI